MYLEGVTVRTFSGRVEGGGTVWKNEGKDRRSGTIGFPPCCQSDPRSDALKRGFEQGCRAAAGAQARRRGGEKEKRRGWLFQRMCGTRGARPNHCNTAGAPAAPRGARPGPQPQAREGTRGGRPAGGAAGAAPSGRAGRRGWAWARRGAVRGRLPAPGRRALRAVVEAAVGGDAAALLLRCRRECRRRRQLRARTPVHGTQGGGRPSCPSLARRRAALLSESGGRERRRSPPGAAAPAGRRRAARGSSPSGRGRAGPLPAPSPSRRGRPEPAPAARARRDDLPQQQRQPRGQQQLQDALSQAGEAAAAGMPRGGRRPRFTKGGSAWPDTALLVGGTGLGGDLVSEGGGPRVRLGPVP